MKKLGFGLMRLPQLDPANAASVDVEQVKHMVDRFMEKGFTYFDTAWMYAGFASENVAREALVDRYPRDRFRTCLESPRTRRGGVFSVQTSLKTLAIRQDCGGFLPCWTKNPLANPRTLRS